MAIIVNGATKHEVHFSFTRNLLPPIRLDFTLAWKSHNRRLTFKARGISSGGYVRQMIVKFAKEPAFVVVLSEQRGNRDGLRSLLRLSDQRARLSENGLTSLARYIHAREIFNVLLTGRFLALSISSSFAMHALSSLIILHAVDLRLIDVRHRRPSHLKRNNSFEAIAKNIHRIILLLLVVENFQGFISLRNG